MNEPPHISELYGAFVEFQHAIRRNVSWSEAYKLLHERMIDFGIAHKFDWGREPYERKAADERKETYGRKTPQA